MTEYEHREYREGYAVTGYPGLRPNFLYNPSTYQTTGVDVKVGVESRCAVPPAGLAQCSVGSTGSHRPRLPPSPAARHPSRPSTPSRRHAR